MHYFVILHATKGGLNEEVRGSHVEYLRNLLEEGKLIITGSFLDERRGGMFVLDVEDEKELSEIVNNDPAILSGLAKSKFRPYKILFYRK